MISFWLIPFVLLAIYFTIILLFSIRWKNESPLLFAKNCIIEKVNISIIIAIRNEEENIPALIQSLSNQTKTNLNIEAILIDDHSTDNSYTSLLKQAGNHNWIQIYQLEKTETGKKTALQKGISKASGELLVFTDGDCEPGNNWLQTLVNYYLLNNKPDMVIGLIDMKVSNWKEKLFRLEFLSLSVSSAGSALLGFPILCNGANLAVKASALSNYLPNTKIASGDDVFLLHHIKKYGGQIKVLKSRDHLVETNSPDSFASFLNQRERWASKSKYFKDFTTIFIALLVFLTNFILALFLISSIIASNYFPLALAYSIKMLSDAILFVSARDIYKFDTFILWLPIISIIYPFYISYTAIISIKKPFQWKGRKILN